MFLFKIIPFFLVCAKFANGLQILDLSGKWNVRDADNDYTTTGTVPGGIYSDLMDNGIIGDVFVGFNDVDLRWVSKKNWTYSTQIDITDSLYNHDVVNIVFDGIDTFSEVSVNDVVVGTTENMFVQYIFDIKEHIQLGNNSLTIKFLAPAEKARQLFNEHVRSRNYPVPPTCVPTEYHGECHANHIRKMQASFSWDWGPAFPSVGIWKPVYLEAFNTAIIRDVTVDVEETGDSWNIITHVYLSKSSSSDIVTGSVTLKLYTDVVDISNIYSVNVAANEDGEFVYTQSFLIPQLYVKRWWPNGYGTASLYRMKVTFVDENENASVKRFKIGFRTVSLEQNKIHGGRAFYFKVNNVPIFAKGSNSIPINILPEKGQDPAVIRYLLQSAKDVHMNMIRVWGGGVYESDEFYKVADEMGIMIWQDFMFACSMYPATEEFLSTVKDEVRHQVRRLQHHASVVIWAANNENEAALRQNWYATSYNFETYHADYIELYVDNIRNEVFKTDISRHFLTSSPTNGILSEEEDYIADNPQNKFYGDVHFYNYVTDPWYQDIYPVSRFASEYGYQSLPSRSTLLTATNSISDLRYNSEFMAHRQHHPDGDAEMKLLISLQMTLPSEENENFFETFIYYGQILQAMAVKLETEYYRLWRSNVDSKGKGMTMGALYWQLNDVWVAPTWSGIDFKLNWKMLHYFARNFFAPVIITGHSQANDNLDIYIVSDLTTNVYNTTATITLYNWNSMDVVHEEKLDTHVLSGYSSKILSFWMLKYLSDNGCGVTNAEFNCVIRLTLTDIENNPIAPDNFVFPSSLRSANLTSPTVKVNSVQQIDVDGKEFEVKVQSDGIALFVWLETGNVRGIFSDNGFLQFNEIKTIRFTAESATTANALSDVITVTHLRDTQYL